MGSNTMRAPSRYKTMKRFGPAAALICLLLTITALLSVNSWRQNTLDDDMLWASIFNDDSKVIALLKKGANPNYCDERGRTAIMWMAKFGKKTADEALIQHGADVRIRDNHGSSIIMWARTNGYRGNEDIVALLKNAGESD